MFTNTCSRNMSASCSSSLAGDTGQLGDQHLVDRRAGREVEGVEGLDGREACRLQPPLGRPLLPVEQFEFEELEEVAEVVDVVGGTAGRCCLLYTSRCV